MVKTFDSKKGYKEDCSVLIIPCCKKDLDNSWSIKELYYNIPKNIYGRSLDTISDEELIMFITDYYNDVLSALDPMDMFSIIKDHRLISDERTDSLALRHIVSSWLQLYTGEKIYESELLEDGTLKRLERPERIKNNVEAIIRKIHNISDEESVREKYLEAKASKETDEERARYLMGAAIDAKARYDRSLGTLPDMSLSNRGRKMLKSLLYSGKKISNR